MNKIFWKIYLFEFIKKYMFITKNNKNEKNAITSRIIYIVVVLREKFFKELSNESSILKKNFLKTEL